uniref:Histone-lysine N-methyltransferase trithorax n=1 Tax=Colaphellus bowringi TaxID=561076 RepID=A0A9E8M5N4_9CUCU|nr:histone-lysine N-methyltransferase trithorax [Colaphellus bowringi]
MGRSKFPGKPSKHIHRKRVNVLPPTGDISNVESSSSVTVDSVVENKQDEDVTESDSESLPTGESVNKKVSIKRRLTRKMKPSIRNKNTNKRNLLSKMCSKSSVKPKLNKGTRTTLTRKSVHGYPTSCRTKVTNESTNLVGKFVLPTRSVHSSRVIKPNKRFISDLNEGITLKKKVSIAKRHVCVKQEEEKLKIKTMCIESGSFNSDSDKTTFTNGHRVVLRQARLKLPNQIGTQGPFSTKPNNSPSGTVTCGVCGAVRFYRFVKQARKFNIYSCESCRKFIAKMLKRQACGSKNTQTTLICIKGQGSCHIPPVVRNQQWKLTKCAYRARCPACWLKMCLRSFHMPPTLKQALILMLPKNMQGLDIALSNALPPLLWQANVEPKLLIEKPQETTTLKQRPVRFKNPKVQPVPNLIISNSDIKRQRIDFKGPRVKHVCRSASIVLGQPIATFTEGEKKCETQEQSFNDIKLTDDKVVNDKIIAEVKHTTSTKCDTVSSESESNCSDRASKTSSSLSDTSESINRRDKLSRNSYFSMQNCLETKLPERKKNLLDIQNGISIDFWDGYDPESICQNGFCIIGSEQFPMSSICFLCGSAGKEAMLYCSMCCEPYHSFCLEQSQVIPTFNNIKQDLWTCPRCTTCNECNQIDRLKVNCQKCLKSYHPECFNAKWSSEDKPTICSKCMRCKSCGTENITKFVGNLPLCVTCFKLRKKGNYCPLCQHCYDENECCSKMMECAKCLKWVHAKCEHLTEEQYQILSILPESVEYICSSCCKNSSPYWRKALSTELKTCLNQVLRLLSKNKTARNLLKWSPLNNSVPSSKAVTNVRKLTFSDEDTDLDNNNYCSKDITDVNKIYTFDEDEKYETTSAKVSSALSMVDIKNKLNANEFCSVKEFYKEIEESLKSSKSEQLFKIYQSIFHDVFPWYEHTEAEEEPEDRENISSEEIQNNIPIEENSFADVVASFPDTRLCNFCKKLGDGLAHQESRLLYCGQNEWVHANCALWSSEVYEEIDGSLQNVQNALNRGRLIRCSHCKQKGASVGCCFKACHETFHFICAQKAKLNFMHDKTVFCSSHELAKNSHVITADKDFEIHRSVYVELDQKKRKYSDIDKVNFMIGSLCVKNLGKIDPIISDSDDVIIPLGFVCTRLYWSTVEPWKLVPYTITTSMRNNNNCPLTIDRNFTIDHTLEKTVVDKLLKEVNAWQRDIDKKIQDVESDDDEEQQNGGDILSPEIADAILEDIPHDFLDGISLQDLFPKFSYDEILTMDYKTDVENPSETSKKTDLDEESDLDLKTKDVKRIKPDIHKFDSISRPQRSCSLTLSCKLDSSLPPAVKKRKIAAARESNMIYQLLQVDGNFDESSSSECGSPNGTGETDPWGTYVSEEPVTCDKCQSTYRTQASYKRHLESCEMLCTSESDSELNADQEVIATYANPAHNSVDSQLLVDINEPVVISSFESYQSEIHTSVLNTQSFVASKSTSEILSVPPVSEVVIRSIPQPVEQKSLLQTVPVNTVTPISLETSHTDQSYTISQPTIIGDPSISIQTSQPQFCVNQSMPLCVSQPISLQPNTVQVNPTSNYGGNQVLSINPAGSISINQMQPTSSIAINQMNQPSIQQPLDFHQTQSVTIQSVPYNNTILNVGSQNQFALNNKLINPVLQTVNVPSTQWMKQVTKPTVIAHKTLKSKARSRTIAAKRPTHFEDGETIILPAQSSTGQVIVQHLPSTNYVPTFVDAFQQQGQNLQYVATITPPCNGVSTQSLVQIQPDNNIISIVPGLQQTMYLQQPRVENQLIVDSNGTLGWSQQQTVQPVYYGFETIVQNTVMQSQQFLPTTLPGVLTANSSYSTTTQVFQTSKLEPVLDVSSNSFVLVNPGQLVNSQPIVNSQNIISSQPLLNSQQMVNSQSMVNSHPIVNSQPIVNSPQMMSSQQIVNSQQIMNSQPIVNSQQIVNSQPIVNSQIMNTQPIVNSQHLLTHQPIVSSQHLVASQHTVNTPSANSQSIVGTQPIISSKTMMPPMVTSQSVFNSQPEVNQYSRPTSVNVVSNVIPHRQVAIKVSRPIEIKPSQSQHMKYSQPVASHKHTIPVTTTHSITLPTAPFISEQGIPTNIVTPIPKPPSSVQSRPMSRVLPMPTNNVVKETKKITCDDEKMFFIEEKKEPLQMIRIEEIKTPVRQLSKTLVTQVESKKVETIEAKLSPVSMPTLSPPTVFQKIVEGEKEASSKPESPNSEPSTDLKQLEPVNEEILSEKKESEIQKPVEISIPENTKLDTSLKLVFQKQGQDGTYIISNNFTSKHPIQVAPLKPIKSNSFAQISSVQPPVKKHQKSEEKVEEKTENLETTLKSVKKENENSPSILYTMETQDGFKYSSSSVSDLWSRVLEAVQTARAAHNMPPLPTNSSSIMNSVHIMGFKSNGLKYLIEQLPGATKCSKYKSFFKFPPHPSDIDDEYGQDHIYGTIRCAPYQNQNNEPYDMFGWLSSKHRQPEEISLDTLELLPRRVVNLPMAMKFRQLKLTSKYSVGVYRSLIHGRGLFCLRDIEAGEMVIEYAGEVIRSILTDKREKYYNSKGIGCYMFRVDDNFVVDATMKGNAARFINHSCDPNCYSRVVEILGHKHIIIFALRRILSGEELTYDYKFPFEEDKIPCTCGSRKCRKFLN